MTHDEFYSRLLENRRIIQSGRNGPRWERRAWVSRASIADDPTAAETQCDLWRSDDSPLPNLDRGNRAGGVSADGRVVGRIAGGQIIPMEVDDPRSHHSLNHQPPEWHHDDQQELDQE